MHLKTAMERIGLPWAGECPVASKISWYSSLVIRMLRHPQENTTIPRDIDRSTNVKSVKKTRAKMFKFPLFAVDGREREGMVSVKQTKIEVQGFKVASSVRQS